MATSGKPPFSPSTLDASIHPESSGCLTHGSGEPLLVIDRLCNADPRRLARRQSLFACYHLTDSHHSDTATGRSFEIARQFDRGDGELGRAYRVWAPFTGATLVSAVRTLSACKASALSGRPVDMLVLGGDFINNSQVNELSSFASIFRGETTRPFKQGFTLHGTQFTHEPEAVRKRCSVAEAVADLLCCHKHAKPLTFRKAASTPIAGSQPLPYPAAFVLGNHDLKALGHMSHSWLLSLWAMQPFKALTKRPVQVDEIKQLTKGLNSREASVRAAAVKGIVKLFWRERRNLSLAWSGFDFSRRGVSLKKAWRSLEPLLAGLPCERSGEEAYYTCRPVPGLVLVMLDTTARGGSGEGQLEHEQFTWLERELKQAENRQELAIVISHHPSYKLVDRTPHPGSGGPIHLARDFIKLLLNSKAVIAHVAGHTHTNRVLLRRHLSHPSRAYWEINTCSMVEWPQQFRFLELFRNGDGTLSLVTHMMNHQAPPQATLVDVKPDALVLTEDTAVSLASYARTLSYRDGLLGAESMSGRHAVGRHHDRNVELLIRDPYS